MSAEHFHIKKCIEAIEAKLDWGEGKHWTHQDFTNLSERILEETGESISYITLKRIWGKVTYNSLPNLNTLDTLAHFLGHTSWRSFQSQQGRNISLLPLKNTLKGKIWMQAAGLILVAVVILMIIPGANNQPPLYPEDYSFSSKKVVTQGVPNSVIFDVGAQNAPYDSVEVQQSWDARLRTRIPKDHTQHTSIYYYPGFFEAKLVVGGQIMQEHDLHITTDGWYCAIEQDPVPLYFPINEVMQNGRLELKQEQILGKNLSLQPQPPLIRMGNIRNFDDLKADNFVFETTLRHTYNEGSAACQRTSVYLLCEGNIILIPLVAKGCVSSTKLYFIDHYASGKEKDLSAFGVDFSNDIHLKIACVDGQAKVYLYKKMVYSIPEKIRPVAIKGIDFRFRGLGSVSEVRLGRPNEEWILHDTFE